MPTTAPSRRRVAGWRSERVDASDANPVKVSVSTVVVRSGTATRRTLAFCAPSANASRTVMA
jgi:hypothetical protein